MREGMRATYSRRAASKNSEIKKDEQSALEKEDVAESKLEIERIRSDPNQLQSMTVKELKELTRRMGVSARGNHCPGSMLSSYTLVVRRRIQVMEEAALIDHVRSLFGQLGSSTAVVPHSSFLQDPITKTLVHNSRGVPTSSHLGDLPGGVNASSPLNGIKT